MFDKKSLNYKHEWKLKISQLSKKYHNYNFREKKFVETRMHQIKTYISNSLETDYFSQVSELRTAFIAIKDSISTLIS